MENDDCFNWELKVYGWRNDFKHFLDRPSHLCDVGRPRSRYIIVRLPVISWRLESGSSPEEWWLAFRFLSKMEAEYLPTENLFIEGLTVE